MGWFADRKAKKKEKREREARLRFLEAPVIPQPRANTFSHTDDDTIRVYDEYGNREDPVMEAVVGTAFATGKMVSWNADEGMVVHETPVDSSPSPAPVDCAPSTTPVDYPSDHVTVCEPTAPPYESSTYDYGSSSSSSYDSGSSYSGGDSGGGGYSGGE